VKNIRKFRIGDMQSMFEANLTVQNAFIFYMKRDDPENFNKNFNKS